MRMKQFVKEFVPGLQVCLGSDIFVFCGGSHKVYYISLCFCLVEPASEMSGHCCVP